MPHRPTRPVGQRAAAVVVAGLTLTAGAVAPAHATPAAPPAEKAVQPTVVTMPNGGHIHLGPLAGAALSQPLPAVTLHAFGVGPLLAAEAQARAEKAAAARAAKAKAAKEAAAKKAAAKKAAAKKAAAKRAAAKRAAVKKAAARKAKAARTAAGERASRSKARVSGSPRAIARSMVSDRGWGAQQFRCLDRLWEKESNWRVTADNPTSSAYGIPQALPGSKMSSAGADWRTNPATQIRWGLQYISSRYGTPCAAWAHSRANNWY